MNDAHVDTPVATALTPDPSRCEMLISLPHWSLLLVAAVAVISLTVATVIQTRQTTDTEARLRVLESKVTGLEQENTALLTAITDPALYKTWVERADDYGRRLDDVSKKVSLIESQYTAAVTRMREALNPTVFTVDPDAVAEEPKGETE